MALFAATVTGGELIPQPGEVTELAFFAPFSIPGDLLVGQRERIVDAMSGASGLARSSEAVFPFPSQEAALRARDDSELSRSAFHAAQIAGPNAAPGVAGADEPNRTG